MYKSNKVSWSNICIKISNIDITLC